MREKPKKNNSEGSSIYRLCEVIVEPFFSLHNRNFCCLYDGSGTERNMWNSLLSEYSLWLVATSHVPSALFNYYRRKLFLCGDHVSLWNFLLPTWMKKKCWWSQASWPAPCAVCEVVGTSAMASAMHLCLGYCFDF
jgi:hypothetical protein